MYYVSLLILLPVVCPASASELKTTKQALPQACTDWFTMDLKDCPLKDVWPKEWDELNAKCCPGFPGTVLHCQRRSFDNGDLYNIPACLPELNVPAGQAGMLETDSDGNPTFVLRPCDSSYFEDTDRMSSGVTFPYCTQTKDTGGSSGWTSVTPPSAIEPEPPDVTPPSPLETPADSTAPPGTPRPIEPSDEMPTAYKVVGSLFVGLYLLVLVALVILRHARIKKQK